MKKQIILFLAVCVLCSLPLSAQKGGFLKKAAKSLSNEILGNNDNPDTKSTEPEPDCANDQAELVMDLGGNLNLNYYELAISVLDDGSILAQKTGSDEFYTVKNGVTQGPYKSGDPAIKAFEPKDPDNKNSDPVERYGKYISRSGRKYLITFAGKNYGPYAQINEFLVSLSGDKFAAMVVKTMAVTEDEAKKMEEEIKNAKTQQEQAQLAMQYAQQMQQNVNEGGGVMSTMPTLVTNIPDVHYDFLESQGETLDNKIKYDDILAFTSNSIKDLKGNTIFTLNSDTEGASDLFINSDNTKYAAYKYGTLTFSDHTKLSGLFNPRLVKENGQEYLAYMYYSPKRNSIMQYKMPF